MYVFMYIYIYIIFSDANTTSSVECSRIKEGRREASAPRPSP